MKFPLRKSGRDNFVRYKRLSVIFEVSLYFETVVKILILIIVSLDIFTAVRGAVHEQIVDYFLPIIRPANSARITLFPVESSPSILVVFRP